MQEAIDAAEKERQRLLKAAGKAPVKEKIQRVKPDLTHFLSIPIPDSCFIDAVEHLKKQICLAKPAERTNVTKQLFKCPSTFHLTLLPLNLKDPKRFEMVTKLLHLVESQI